MKTISLIFLSLFLTLGALSQHKCKSHVHLQEDCIINPERGTRLAELEESFKRHKSLNNAKRGGADLTIPVVVHVLWNSPDQNISDEQIYSQMEALNEDFNLLNFDAPDGEHPFFFESSESGIEFCLAQQDPFGDATNGINRVWTPIPLWDESTEVGIKYSSEGGVDNWDPEHYLNIWIASFSPDYGTLGYATFPDDLVDSPEEDGVVVRSNAFGYLGTVSAPNDLGRTATHEVGHWLFLRHIWGDDICGDDLVDDTPTHFEPNYGCPDFPHNPFSDCGTDEVGEMYMNFMDYVDDNCMNMFSFGQTERMWWAIDNFRFELYNSAGCEPAVSISVGEFKSDEIKTMIQPNPTNDFTRISFNSMDQAQVQVFDLLGKVVWRGNVFSGHQINVSEFNTGTYVVEVRIHDHVSALKMIVQ